MLVLIQDWLTYCYTHLTLLNLQRKQLYLQRWNGIYAVISKTSAGEADYRFPSWWFHWYVCLCALVSSPHVAVVYPASALAHRLVVTLISAFLFLHGALYETLDQLLVAADLLSFPTAHCRVAEDSRIQDADDVGCVCTCVLEREPRAICSRVFLYILQASTCPVRAASSPESISTIGDAIRIA